MPCGVSFNTPQGKGEGEESINSRKVFVPLPFIVRLSVRLSSRRSPLPPGEGKFYLLRDLPFPNLDEYTMLSGHKKGDLSLCGPIWGEGDGGSYH